MDQESFNLCGGELLVCSYENLIQMILNFYCALDARALVGSLFLMHYDGSLNLRDEKSTQDEKLAQEHYDLNDSLLKQLSWENDVKHDAQKNLHVQPYGVMKS